MEQIYDYTIKLIRYALNGDMPELPDDIDFERFFAFGKSHGVENMLYVGLRDLNIAVPEDTMKKFKKAYEMAIMLEAKQAFELEAIGAAFEEFGIDHIPLKGSIIKYFYPMPDYRKSGDIDILIRAKDEEKISLIMEKLGYRHEKEKDSHEVHFSYTKKPYMEIEVHRQLVRMDDRSYKFCSKAWRYAVLREGNKHTYTMSNEYLYMHLMAHLCKHLYLGGAGIRHIMDFYVMQKKIALDEKLLKKYLRQANLIDLNSMVEKLVKRWFEGEVIRDKDIDILERLVFTSGSFGTREMRETMSESLTKSGNIKRFISRMFPPVRILKNRYPILERKPHLLFFFWIYRFFEVGIFERHTIHEKVSESFNNEKKADELQNIVKAIKDRGVKYESKI